MNTETTTTETTAPPAAPIGVMAKPNRKTTAAPAARKAVKKTSSKGTAKPATEKDEPKDGRIPLKRLCAELAIEPRAARRRLRAKMDKDMAFHVLRDRWLFTETRAAKARAILQAPEATETK